MKEKEKRIVLEEEGIVLPITPEDDDAKVFMTNDGESIIIKNDDVDTEIPDEFQYE